MFVFVAVVWEFRDVRGYLRRSWSSLSGGPREIVSAMRYSPLEEWHAQEEAEKEEEERRQKQEEEQRLAQDASPCYTHLEDKPVTRRP